MAVDTFYQYRLAIDKQLTVLDFDVTEAQTLANHLKHLVLLLQRYYEVIQVGRLGCPGLDILRVEHEMLMMIIGPFMTVVLEDDIPLQVFECDLELDA